MGIARKTGIGGLNFFGGLTWHQGAWVHSRLASEIPCFELQWDEQGVPSPTGRYALLTETQVNHSQAVDKPHLEVGDREMSLDDYRAEINRLAKIKGAI